jgi:TolB-like protein/class 3 adenylate cyclase/Flp pilus assembly protein TadD
MPLAREQRKLAAIVAADVVGYSRLMGRDESGTLARLRKNRSEHLDPVLAKYGGRLVKLTGDGALIEFASAVDALSAAIEFQQAMAEANSDQPADDAFVFRMGLHLGDLIVDGDDLYGDGVNVAARLEAEAPAGGIVISRTVHEAVTGRLKATFGDLGGLALKNIERPVQAFGVKWEPSDWQPPVTSEVTIASATAQVPLPLPDKPSIAVLPFQNMSGDPEQEYFVDGLVEDITTALSRNRGLFVTARNSSFTYRGQAVDIRQVGRQLGVRYVLEGSVRKSGGKVRITGQLIEAESGSHVWADRFDGSLQDVFELQDQVANRVASVISPAVEMAEIERTARKTANLQAYDLFLQAKAAFYGTTWNDLHEALSLAEQCLALDPKFARCHVLIAAIYHYRVVRSMSSDPAADAAAAERAAQKALALDGNDATAFMQYGAVLVQALGRYDDGLSLVNKAIDLDPNLAAAWALRGVCKGGQGRVDEAIQDHEHALRLSPRDPLRWLAQHGLAWAHLMAGRYEEAIRWASTALQLQPNLGITLRVAIAANALAGRLDEARQILAKHSALEPQTRISTIRATYLRRVTLQSWEILADGLRKAGFPE